MAREVGFVIDTDSHHTSDLVRMGYGVTYAQRGWVTTDRVINAKPVTEFLNWTARRR
jgi:histidinol phosphatase-like PHP family hydrolase